MKLSVELEADARAVHVNELQKLAESAERLRVQIATSHAVAQTYSSLEVCDRLTDAYVEIRNAEEQLKRAQQLALGELRAWQ